jgi:glycosyltransferase involved in cell wall biosynthesis
MARVLFVDQSANLGGAELSLLSIAEYWKDQCRVVVLADGPFVARLKERKINATLISLPRAILDIRRGAGLGTVVSSLPTLIPAILRLALLARRYRVIYANTQKAFVLAAVSGWFARRPVVWHLRDILDEAHFSHAMITLAIWMFNRFGSRLIANSKATADAFIARGGDPSRVAVVWNGVDPRPFIEVPQPEIDRVRESLGVRDTPLVGVFSRLSPWKGQHVLIEALRYLPGVHALIVGEVLFGEEDYAAELSARAQRDDVVGRVHFLGFRDDIPLLMRAVDIVAHTSTAPEPFGRVLVEGMLSEKPVIATMGGGTAEIIENGVSGTLVPPGNPKVLAAAIRQLLAPSREKGKLVAAALRRAVDVFSLDAMLRGIDHEIAAFREVNAAKVPLLFVDQSGAPGGAELVLLSLAQHMGAHCRVVVLSDGEFPDLLARSEVAHTVLPMPRAALSVRRESGVRPSLFALPGVLFSTFRLIGMVSKAEIVYANTQKAFVTAALAAWIARRPIIWHLHDILSEAHFSRFLTKVVVWLSNRLSTRIIANSQATADALIAAGGDPKRIEVIWNGIDSKPFDSVTEADVSALRAFLGIGETPLVGAFGRLAPWKGQHVLIEALRELPGVHALIVGQDLYGEREYEAALRQTVTEGGLADRVHFLGFRTDIPLLMRAVDVVVHTSTAPEPFGRVIVEGMMAGRPVVATAGGGPEEILENGTSGIIVPPNDIGALAAAIRRLLEPGAWRNRIVAAAQSRAHRLFSLSSMLDQIDDLIYRVANPDVMPKRQRPTSVLERGHITIV